MKTLTEWKAEEAAIEHRIAVIRRYAKNALTLSEKLTFLAKVEELREDLRVHRLATFENTDGTW